MPGTGFFTPEHTLFVDIAGEQQLPYTQHKHSSS